MSISKSFNLYGHIEDANFKVYILSVICWEEKIMSSIANFSLKTQTRLD